MVKRSFDTKIDDFSESFGLNINQISQGNM